MQTINKPKVMSKFGCVADNVVYTKKYVQDTLLIDGDSDGYTVLRPQSMTPYGDIQLTVSPYLLALGATFTGIVDQGDEILVFLPMDSENIDLERAWIRGYLI